jgi:anti-sigma-K factor RskA
MSSPNGTVGEHPLDDLAAYALDALGDAERQAVDDHLALCPECQAELAAHHETLASLTTASEEAPPAAVWERVAAGIGASGLADPSRGGSGGSGSPPPLPPVALEAPPAQPPTPAAGPTDAADSADPGGEGGTVTPLTDAPRLRGARPWGTRWLAIAAAALLVAAIAGGAVGYVVGSSGDADDIDSLADRAGEDPEGVLATLDDAGGRPVARVVGDEDGAYLVLEGLQDLPEGQAYQLWSLTGPEPVSLGMMGRDGNNTVAFRLPPTITELAISVAPTSGAVAPSGEFEASGSIIRQATPS